MAVRRQLRLMFQDPQVTGTIVVERASLSATPAWISPPLPPPPPPSPPSPPSSLPPAAVPASPPASPPRQQGSLPEECAVFHCRDCWTVLGDSLQLCGQEPPGLSVLICFKVTSDVTWEDSLSVGLDGALVGCTYYLLSCRSCGLALGFSLYSSDSDLAYLRGLFCFFKNSIMCYLLKHQKTIEASKVNFPAVTLKEHTHRLKERLLNFNDHIELAKRNLEKLEQSNYLREWQNPS